MIRLSIYFFISAIIMLPFFARAEDAPAKVPLFNVTYEQAEQAVADALTQKGAGAKVAASITGRRPEALFAYTKPLNVDVRGITYDKATSRWSANILAVSEGNVMTAVPVSGHFDEMMEAPVLKRMMRNGETITAKDIEVRDFPLGHTRNDTVADMNDLIGKSPIRAISAFRPVREAELTNPAMVKKNTMVKMRYEVSGMEISANGQAMEDGAQGRMINIKNLESKKIIQAVVQDATTVVINPQPQAAPAVNASAEPLPQGDNPYAVN